jgi:hypothetical protein
VTSVRFARLSDVDPPARELLQLQADGSLSMWRSVARAVGRFTGPAEAGATIAALAREAAAAPVPAARELGADTTMDRLEVGDAVVTLGEWDHLPGPWGALLDACRALLEPLLDRPTAAIRLVQTSPTTVRLEHLGDGVLTIELGAAVVQVELRRDGLPAGGPEPVEIDGTRVDAGPGWSLEVEVSPVGLTPGDRLLATASFVADDEGVYVPMLAWSLTDE